MSFIARLQRAREILAQQGRLSTRALERELEIGGDDLDEIIEELVDVQQVARREGKILVWAGAPGTGPSPSTQPTDTAGARKVVTVIFADLIGSTALHERLDAESVTRLMDRYYETLRGAVEAHGGTVVKLMGDGVMAAFGVPRVAEDDAIRAVRAGMAMQDAFRELARQEFAAVGDIGLRVGINTGEVVVTADNTDVVGDPVNVAARLQAEAHDGAVVIGESTRRLVAAQVTLAPLGSFALKGRAEAIKAYRVASLDRPIGSAAAAFVGRDDEIARITAVYEAACVTPAARLAVLLGSPGLGKSRLIAEVTLRLGDAASVVTAHCDAAGGATFAPVAAALREFFRIEASATPQAVQETIAAAIPATDTERLRIAAGIATLLAGAPASPEETFFVIRRLLAGRAATTPVVLVIDDVQWAEPLLLDLVEHLVQWGSGTPLFVLLGARPELRDLRSSLVTPGGLVSEVVTLAGLDAGAAMRLAANVIGAADLPAAVAAKVLATSEGNPLFVGELVRMLVDEGAIERQGDRWIVGANLAALEMPPTIHALLAARIERLGPEDRTVLERAAVVGRHFSRSAVAALLGRNGSELNARLEALQRTELIERDTGWFLGEPVLRFHHVLIRDAAYRRLLKGTRAELHEQLADWIEAQVKDAPEHDETIGWHLEQAHQHRRELGPVDAKGKTLGERAAARLAAAGRRALARDDLPVAADLLGRAIDRLDRDDPARAELALDWCEALLAAGNVGPAGAAIDELGRVVADSARLRAWHTCFTGQLTVLTAPQALHTTADTVAAAAEDLATLGDAAGVATGHFVHALALARLGKVGGCEAALDRALAAARRVGDRRRANTVLAIAPLAALWGPGPVTRASGRCLDVVRVLRITQGAPAVEAVALSCQGVLEALRGRPDAARRMIAAARKMVEDLGLTQRLLETTMFGGLIDLLEGDAPAAEHRLRSAYEGLRDLGLGIGAAQAAALLARALLAQDRAAEAETLSHESEALAGDDLKAAIAWRGVRAEALARRGEAAAAVAFASQAVEIAAATDALLDHADARLALAAALRAAGHGAEAHTEERRAIALWEAKGATLLVERTHTHREPAAPGPVTGAGPIAAPPAARRRVRPNAATALLARNTPAIAARDFDALAANLREDYEEIDHPTGSTYGKEVAIASLERLFRSREPHYETEPLATLGESLLLHWRRTGAAGTVAGARYDVGANGNDAISLLEVDDSGLVRRSEVFAADRLNDARVRLYERYAELLPEGPERTRAAAAAQSLDSLRRSETDPDLLAPALAPDFEGVDHRHLGLHSLRGAAAYVEHLRSWRQVADDIVFRERDILALEPHGMLINTMHTGTARAGGGAYERPFLTILLIDSAGRLARAEWFEADREAEALARFDALVPRRVEGIVAGAEPKHPVPRRVRPNAATAATLRLGAAFAARDVAAVEAVLGDGLEVTDHRWHISYGRDGFVKSFRGMMKPQGAQLHVEPIATLGERLSLERFDVGETAIELVRLVEVDSSGEIRRFDIFADDHLGDAIARLYERYAELQREGPARTRAAATAHAFAAWLAGGSASERALGAEALAPGVDMIDHRTLGLHNLRGAAAMRDYVAAMDDLEQGAVRMDDFRCRPNAMLMRYTKSGVVRASGGAFERQMYMLWQTDDAGRMCHFDLFDVEQEAEALARFDALTADARDAGTVPAGIRDGGVESRLKVAGMAEEALLVSSRRVRPNAATARRKRFDAALAARDFDAVAAGMHEEYREIDHPTGSEYGRDATIASLKRLFRSRDPYYEIEPLATLGEHLLLTRRRTGASGDTRGRYDVGPYENEAIEIAEVDVHGLNCRQEVFAAYCLGAALVRLYERHAELLPEGPERTRAAGLARTLAAFNGRVDLDRVRAVYAPSHQLIDHRVFGTWSAGDAEETLRHFRLQRDLAPDFAGRYDDAFAVTTHAVVARMTFFGTASDSGGPFENKCCVLFRIGADGYFTHTECWETEQVIEALARFDEVSGRDSEMPTDWFENAAAFTDRELFARFNARDWPGIEALAAPNLLFDERRRMVRNTCGRDVWLEQFRVLYDVPASRFTTKLLGTRGERLSLSLHRFTGEVAGGGGPLEMDDHLVLHEIDGDGRLVAIVLFDLEDEDAAWKELDARFEAEQGERLPASWTVLRRWIRAFADRDWEAVASLCADDLVEHDNRSLAVLGVTRGVEPWIQVIRAVSDLAPDSVFRVHHFIPGARGYYEHGGFYGTREGGPFEIAMNALVEIDGAGLIARIDTYDDDRVFAASRWAELGIPVPSTARESAQHDDPRPPGVKPNAAARSMERFWAASDASDFDAARTLFAPGFVWEDRRPLFRLSGDVELMLASAKERLATGARIERRSIVGTVGDRVAVARVLWAGGPPGGRFEVEFLAVQEVDETGLGTALIFFDPDDARAAQREAWARWATIDPTVADITAWIGESTDAWNAKDLERMRAGLSEDLVVEDRRWTGTGRSEGREAYLRSVIALWELAPESRGDAGLFWLAIGPHGSVSACRRSGTLPGGGEFVSDFLMVNIVERGVATRLEFFEVDAAEAALARFDELSAPTGMPPSRKEPLR